MKLNDVLGPALPPPARLLHYSQKPSLLRPLSSTPLESLGPEIKPKGLWISVEGEYDWRWWCLGERFRLTNLRHVHEVKLTPSANILWIRTIEQLDEFDRTYAVGFDGLVRSYRVDWRAVATKYAGIIITPYQWERRLGGMLWYYAWDCASGCIWDINAIESVRLTDERGVDERAIKREIHSRTSKRKHKKIYARLKKYMADEDAKRAK